MTKQEAETLDPWSERYLEKQRIAVALVAELSTTAKEAMRRSYNENRKFTQRIKQDGGLIRCITVSLLAGEELP